MADRAHEENGFTGRKAVSFALPDTEGVVHRQEDYLGAWLLLVFHRHLG